MSRPRFHLAFAVHDLDAARRFYSGLLGFGEGRSADRWVDFDFAGHQISAHLVDAAPDVAATPTNAVDDDAVPVCHFGLVLDFTAWDALRARLDTHGVTYLVPPKVRFAGQPGEQRTLFIRDPSGNALEFKAFPSDAAVFATDDENP